MPCSLCNQGVKFTDLVEFARELGADCLATGHYVRRVVDARQVDWAARRPGDAELALTLGALCLRQMLWGKAQRHLEQALSDASEPAMVREAHLKLAQLHEALGQQQEAAAHYRQCALATIL